MKHHLCIISSDSTVVGTITRAFKPLGIEVDHAVPSLLLERQIERSAKITLVDLESFDSLPHAVWENLRKSLDHTFYIPLMAKASNTVHRKWFGNPVKTLSKPLTSGQLRWLVFQCVGRLNNHSETHGNQWEKPNSRSSLVNTLQAVLKHQHRDIYENQARVTNLVDLVGAKCQLDSVIQQAISSSARLYELGALLEQSKESQRPDRSMNRRRCFHSAAIAKVSGAPSPVVRILRNIDENWDGSGAPGGKKGKEIPIGARMLRIAIDFVNLQFDGKKGLFLSTSEAAGWLRDASGKLYDPSLIKAFLDYLLAESKAPETATLWIFGARNLQPGMTLSEDLYGRAGLKLLSKGKVLNAHLVSRLLDYEDRFGMRDGLFAGVVGFSPSAVQAAN
jgi:hypothetical protein